VADVSEQNFLAKYNDLTEIDPTELRRLWAHYDTDGSGYIEVGGEFEKFVTDMLRVTGKSVTELMVQDVVSGILELVDLNNDGRLSIDELEQLLKMVD
jgi:Ca2+-binding EF-hand superfamily protein